MWTTSGRWKIRRVVVCRKVDCFMAMGAGSVPLLRCGWCVPKPQPQGFSRGLRCHHAVPQSASASVPSINLHSATFLFACWILIFISATGKFVITFFPCSKMLYHLKCPLRNEGLYLKQRATFYFCHKCIYMPRFFSIKLQGRVLFKSYKESSNSVFPYTASLHPALNKTKTIFGLLSVNFYSQPLITSCKPTTISGFLQGISPDFMASWKKVLQQCITAEWGVVPP